MACGIGLTIVSDSAATLLPPFGRPLGLGTASRQVLALDGCLRQFRQGRPWSHLICDRLQAAHATTGRRMSSYEGDDGEEAPDGEGDEDSDGDREVEMVIGMGRSGRELENDDDEEDDWLDISGPKKSCCCCW